MRRPEVGDVYVPLEDYSTTYLVHWKAPIATDGPCVVTTEDRLEVVSSVPASASAAYLRPVDCAGFEERQVPEAMRKDARYAGISLIISLEDLETKFRRVDT